MHRSLGGHGRTRAVAALALAAAACGGETATPTAPPTPTPEVVEAAPTTAGAPDVAAFLSCLASLEPCANLGGAEGAAGVACTDDVARCARDAMPTRTATEDAPGDEPAAPRAAHPCLPDEAAQQAMRTVQLLRALEEAMRGWTAAPTTTADEPRACITAVAAANDPALASRAREERERRGGGDRRGDAARTLTLTNIAWTWDPTWETRQIDVPVRDCWDASFRDWIAPDYCTERRSGFAWRVRSTRREDAYVVDGTRVRPEIISRAEAAHLDPSGDQVCIVEDAEASETEGVVTCDGLGVLSHGFRLVVPREAVTGSGALSRVMVGDAVRVHGHGIVRRVHESASSSRGRWQFEAIPVDGLTIAAPSTCCASEPSAATAPTE